MREKRGTHSEREEVKARVDGDNGDLRSTVLVRKPIERLEQGTSGGSDHARVDGRVGDVDDEDVDRRLRRSDLHDIVSALSTSPVVVGRTMYSVGATNSTTALLSSARAYRSAGWFFSWSQSNSCGTSLERLHMQHFHR